MNLIAFLPHCIFTKIIKKSFNLIKTNYFKWISSYTFYQLIFIYFQYNSLQTEKTKNNLFYLYVLFQENFHISVNQFFHIPNFLHFFDVFILIVKNGLK